MSDAPVFPTCVLCHENLHPARWRIAHLPCSGCTRSLIDAAARRAASRHPAAQLERWTSDRLRERSRELAADFAHTPRASDWRDLATCTACLVLAALLGFVAVAVGLGPAP